MNDRDLNRASIRALAHSQPMATDWSNLPWLVGADGFEVLVDKDVVRPVDADVVHLVLAVAQLHNTVDDAPRIGGQRGFRCLVRCRAVDDRPRPLTVVRRDLTDLL